MKHFILFIMITLSLQGIYAQSITKKIIEILSAIPDINLSLNISNNKLFDKIQLAESIQINNNIYSTNIDNVTYIYREVNQPDTNKENSISLKDETIGLKIKFGYKYFRTNEQKHLYVFNTEKEIASSDYIKFIDDRYGNNLFDIKTDIIYIKIKEGYYLINAGLPDSKSKNRGWATDDNNNYYIEINDQEMNNSLAVKDKDGNRQYAIIVKKDKIIQIPY